VSGGKFTHPLNNRIEFRNEEEMKQWHLQLIMDCFNLIEVTPKVTKSPTEFPYKLHGGDSAARLQKLQQLFVCIAGREMLVGFLEELERFRISVPETAAATISTLDDLESRYGAFLKTLNQNVLILQTELNI
jgi:hypothetical protein